MSLFNTLLLAATALGLLLPGPGMAMAPYALVPLSLSMLFSLLASGQKLNAWPGGIKDGLLYSYLFLSGSLLLAALFMPPGMREGLVMYAIFPPAIGVLVLARQWGGSMAPVFVFQLVSYSASVLLVPAAAGLLVGGSIGAGALMLQLVAAFLLPGALSFVVNVRNRELAGEASGALLALLFYIMIAKSQPWILANAQELALYMVPLALLNAAVAYAAYRLTRRPEATLYAMLKNGGAAAAVSLGVLGPAAIAMISAKTLVDAGLILVFSRLWARRPSA